MVLEMEWNGNGKGMEYKDLVYGIIPWENFDFLPIPLGTVPSNSIPFHGIPLSI